MAQTKYMVSRLSAEEVPVEGSSSSGEEVEMEVPPAEEHSDESSAEETGEEDGPRASNGASHSIPSQNRCIRSFKHVLNIGEGRRWG